MSLVNDMLRDLDQRRKQSSGSSATSSLTPVAEVIPEKAKRSALIYLMLALVLGAGAVTWFFMQQDGASTTRQLDIVPSVVSNSGGSVNATQDIAGVSQSTLSNSANQSPTSSNSVNTDEAMAGVADDESISVQNSEIAVSTTDSIVDTEPVASAINSNLTPNQAAGSNRMAQLPTTNDSPASAISEAREIIEPAAQSLAANSARSASDLVDLGAAPAEEVKIESTLSAEEKDVLVVQEALDLIANNNLSTAYEVLEKQVIENRYAHQSRETYAKLLLNEGNLLGAYQLIESGLALSPNHPGFKKIKARLLISQGELTDAVSLLMARAPEMSHDLEYHDILATAQLASRDYEGALISYTGLVQQDQEQGKWWYGFAASQDLLGNQNAARQGYSQAVRMPNLSANLRQRSQERLARLGQ